MGVGNKMAAKEELGEQSDFLIISFLSWSFIF